MDNDHNELMNYSNPSARDDLAIYEGAEPHVQSEGQGLSSIIDLITGVLRRWKLIILIFCLVSIPGLAIIWTFVKPGYETQGAIEVTSPQTIIFNIKDESISDSESFMLTEAAKISSPPVLNRAADILSKKNLNMFKGSDGIVKALQGMTAGGSINVWLERGTHLINIMMYSDRAHCDDAQDVVDAIIDGYISVRASASHEGETSRLSYLESQRTVQKGKLQLQRAVIRRLAEEYGSTDITGWQQKKFDYVARLQNTLNDLQTKRIALEAKRELIKDSQVSTIDPQKRVQMKFDRINSDPTVVMLTSEVTLLEKQLIVANKNYAPENPALQTMTDIYLAMKERLAEKRLEIDESFDADIESQMQQIAGYEIEKIEAEFKSIGAHQKSIEETLAKEDAETREIGQKQLAIRDEQEKLGDIKELLETIRRRITQLEMEGQRPARISVAYRASSIPAKTKQIQYSAACIFAALGMGLGLAFVLDKTDPRLRTPKDFINQIGIPVIGTTTKLDEITKALLPSTIAEDYRTIRANLGLLTPEGMPHKMLITSSGVNEGKTTFSINFATSIAKSGKRVLLIDGDLRKPDIAKTLKLSDENLSLQDLMGGKSLDDVVIRDIVPGMDVLTSAPCAYEPSIACEVLNKLSHLNIIEDISQDYDHVIIDTPPVLAGPDALLWSRIVNGVILTSFSGQTMKPELTETINRLKNVGARVLGSVLHNVQTGHSYYKYGYDYYNNQARKHKSQTSKRPLLISMQTNEPVSVDDDIESLES